jgi:hypothetical protein
MPPLDAPAVLASFPEASVKHAVDATNHIHTPLPTLVRQAIPKANTQG